MAIISSIKRLKKNNADTKVRGGELVLKLAVFNANNNVLHAIDSVTEEHNIGG